MKTIQRLFLTLTLVLTAAFVGVAAVQSAQEKTISKSDRLPLHGTSTFEKRFHYQYAQATVASPTVTIAPQPGTEIKTTVQGGTIAANIIEWLTVAFGSVIATLAAAIAVKVLNYFGVKTTDVQKAQLQSIIVNGINAAATKAKTQLADNRDLDITVKNQIVADAISYTQRHAAETIKALGLDPQSGEAVEAIRARIETAIADPAAPTVIGAQPGVVAKVDAAT